MKEKITLFIGNLTIGGAERVTVNLANQLSKNGHQVEVLVVTKGGALVDELSTNIDLSVLPVNRVRWAAIPLARYLRRTRPDVLISFITGVNVMAIVAARLSRVSTQIIVTEHNTQSEKSKKYRNRDLRLAKYTYYFADNIVGVSNGVTKDVRNWAKVPDSKVITIYNPVVAEDQINATYDIPSHPWFHDENIDVVLSAGRHVEQKDHQTLIQAFAKLSKEHNEARLILLGEGNLTANYESIADNLNVRDKILLPGFVDNIYSYMSHADVFALSSQYEGLSLVLIEAMACGTSVVSTNCPYGPSEVLNDGQYGELVPVGNPELLKNAIMKLIQNPFDEQKLQDRARDFSISKSATKYENLISSNTSG